MKFFAGILVGLCVIGLVSIQPSGKAEGGGATYRFAGEHFWSVSNTVEGTPVSGTLRLGVIEVGEGHYLCSGVFAVTDPLSFQFSTFGNMESLDNEVRGTLLLQGTRCYDEGNCTIGIDMMTITMDPNTLNGTSEGIGVYHDAIEHSKGTVSYIGRELPGDPDL